VSPTADRTPLSRGIDLDHATICGQEQCFHLLVSPAPHATTQKQLTLGAGGFIIVRDAEEAALPLPRTYGVDDIPLTLTSRRFATVDGVGEPAAIRRARRMATRC
jgi:FtsP/CotA-like multicopper oxidase with cupredoxin domain